MDIKELTERYQDRFDAHYLQDDNGTGRKGRKRKKEVETPNFLKDVIRPILDTLPDLLPEYGFTKTTDDYAHVRRVLPYQGGYRPRGRFFHR